MASASAESCVGNFETPSLKLSNGPVGSGFGWKPLSPTVNPPMMFGLELDARKRA
nr:MAG TPA: hypothetical protein [Caudoviricetes sp.]